MLSIGLNLWQWVLASKGPPPPVVETDYVAEDGTTLYVAEDGSTQYVTESSP